MDARRRNLVVRGDGRIVNVARHRLLEEDLAARFDVAVASGEKVTFQALRGGRR